MIKLASTGSAFVLSVTIVFAQPAPQVTQFTEWFAVNASVNFGSKIGLVLDGNFRFVGKMEAMQHMLRGGLEYELTRNLSVVPLGYAYVWNYQYGKQPAAFANDEYRFWHQVQYKHKIGRMKLGHRLRLEERAIERHHFSASNDDLIMDDGFSNRQGRLRYRANLMIPLTTANSGSGKFYANLWDEVHFSWGKSVRSTQPNQNRFFAGIGYQFNKSTSIQTGMIYQLLKKDNGIQRENNMGAMMQLNLGFDALKRPQH